MRSPRLDGPFRTRLDAFAHALEGVQVGDVEALHRARVASRRLRELIPLLQLERDLTRRLARRLRKVTRELGNVRELDVLVLLVDELTENGRYSHKALKRLGATAARARAAARERLSSRLPTGKLQRLTLKLERVSHALETDGARVGRPGSRRAWLWALEARVARRATTVWTAIEAAGAVYAPGHLHGVRVALKKLRYAAEIAAEARGKQTTPDIVALKAAQNLLGRLHDLEMLLVRGREEQAALSPPSLAGWRDLSSLVHAVDDDCRQLHASYVRDRAKLIAIAVRNGASKLDAQLAARLG